MRSSGFLNASRPASTTWPAGPSFITMSGKGIEPETGRPVVDPAHKTCHRQAGRVLPVIMGWQGLAVRRLQPEDETGLCSGQREFLRRLLRREGALGSGQALAWHQARGYRLDGSSRRGSSWRTAGMGSSDRKEGLVAWLRQSQLFSRFPVTATAGDLGVCRRHQRP